MKSFLAAVVAAALLAYAASFVLNSNWQRYSSAAYTTTSARIADPGGNLMGSDWPVSEAGAGENS
jgi:hypothetical protein